MFLAQFWFTLKTEPELSFDDYLREYAPYENEKQLSEHLSDRGIESEIFSFEGKHESEQNRIIELRMLQAYYSKPYNKKIDLLIQHEAKQITRLFLDIENGKRSLFIFSDSKLRGIVEELKFRRC